MDPPAPVLGSGETARIEKQRHFIRAMSKSIEGHPLEQSERALLESIFAALVRGEDVSDLTGIRRPRAQRSTDPVHVALHYLCLTRLMDMRPELAWDVVGEAWGLNRREVQRLIAENHKPALAALPRFAGTPGRLLTICEQHASGRRTSRTLTSGRGDMRQSPGKRGLSLPAVSRHPGLENDRLDPPHEQHDACR